MSEPNDNNLALAEFVKMARDEQGLTQEELADLADMSQEWLSRLERGLVSLPRKTTMVKLAHALAKDIADLYVAAGTSSTRAGGGRVAQSMPEDDPKSPIGQIIAIAKQVDWSDPMKLNSVLHLMRMYREDDLRKRRKSK